MPYKPPLERYYVGDPEKFRRVTTSVRIRVDQLDRIRKERFNLSNFIEDCLDYYWGIRNPDQDIEKIKRKVDATRKAFAAPISKEIKTFKKVHCPSTKSDVYTNFFKNSELCDGEDCEFYKSGECPFGKKG